MSPFPGVLRVLQVSALDGTVGDASASGTIHLTRQ
jgi:hypothetical protein